MLGGFRNRELVGWLAFFEAAVGKSEKLVVDAA